MSVAYDDNETFIVGTESGSIFKCKVGITSQVYGQEVGMFEEFPKSLKWTKDATRVMN